jgi:hypothetical protein
VKRLAVSPKIGFHAAASVGRPAQRSPSGAGEVD